MKFKVSPSLSEHCFTSAPPKEKILRLKGINTLRAVKSTALIRNISADDFGKFDEERIGFFQKIKNLLKVKHRSREPRIPTAALFGVLCGVASVCIISAVLLLSSFFLKYGGSYREIEIPSFISLDKDKVALVATDIFEYEIIYERNPDKKDGSVISQSPLPGVTRRLYKAGDKIKITLSVNTPEDTLTLPKLSGSSLREVLILLKNIGVTVNLKEEYSSTVEYGNIISASLPEGTVVKSGDTITVKSSLGKETVFVSVPDLSGLNENQAIALLRSKNLEIGEIKYESSKMPIGTIISQSIANGASLPEKSKISFTVSGGIYYS